MAFEIVRKDELARWGISEENVIIPTRKTKDSAGYDIHIPNKYIAGIVKNEKSRFKIPTGIKCKFPLSKDKLYLQISLKSGFSVKYPFMLTNGIGIIDADYYNNPDNDGHILLSVYNYSDTWVSVPSGTGIAQGIFVNYTTFGERIEEQRVGGFGSTSK